MKLLLCPSCNEVVKFQVMLVRYCTCRRSWGAYLADSQTVRIGGQAVVLGLDNDSLAKAVHARPETERMSFVAFVFPQRDDHIVREGAK